MALRKQRIVTAPDGRRWTVAREILPARPRARRKYAHDLDPDPVWDWSLLLWGAPCLAVAVVLVSVVVVPVLVVLTLARLAWASALHGSAAVSAGAAPAPPTQAFRDVSSVCP